MELLVTREKHDEETDMRTDEVVEALNKLMLKSEEIMSKGVDQKELNEVLSALSGKIEEKAISVCRVKAKYDAFVEQLKSRKKAIDGLISHYEVQSEGIKSYLKYAMGASGIKSISGPDLKITYSVTRNGKVDCEEVLVPRKYFEEVKTYKLNKEALKEHLENGEAIEGAKLVDVERLTIKGA